MNARWCNLVMGDEIRNELSLNVVWEDDFVVGDIPGLLIDTEG